MELFADRANISTSSIISLIAIMRKIAHGELDSKLNTWAELQTQPMQKCGDELKGAVKNDVKLNVTIKAKENEQFINFNSRII